MADKSADGFDWNDLPDEITAEWVRPLTIGQIKALEAGQMEHMTEAQRAQFADAKREVLPNLDVVGKNLFPKIKVEMLGNWTKPTAIDEITKSIGKQAEIMARDAAEREKWLDSLSADMESIAEAKTARRNAKVQRAERQHELSMEMAKSMAVLSGLSVAQSQANDRQRVLWWILTFAVLFEVGNSTIDDHSVKSSSWVAVAALGILLVGWFVGWLWHRLRRPRSSA